MMRLYGTSIESWDVSKDVRNVRNNRPRLTDRVALI